MFRHAIKTTQGKRQGNGLCQSRLVDLSMPMLVLSGQQDLSSASEVMRETASASKNLEHKFVDSACPHDRNETGELIAGELTTFRMRIDSR